MAFRAPVKEMMFALNEIAGLPQIAQLPTFVEATPDTVHAVLEEAAKFTEQVVAPLNRIGDINPSVWADGVVTTTPGFKEAFELFGEAGWQGLQHPVAYGGQGLPRLLATACTEMLHTANLSFALCPMLTDGAIDALLTAGTDTQKAVFLPKLISGEWTGTMNLTEPQAGSDLAAVRTRAEPVGDGTYKIFGTKIFITYGEHDMAENIVHLVLARTPNAPEGVKGISLFIVPKYFITEDGILGERNDVQCVSIEHKLGIKASPTAVLQFGDNGGAIGSLIGEENRGLEYMFIMMNSARFSVGIQGVSVSERAYQLAVSYAKERVQSRPVDGSSREPVAIIHHPDVKRMLMTMRALIEGARGLAYFAAGVGDFAHEHPDESVRLQNMAVYEWLVPVVKGWSTELSTTVTSLGVQVHGGMGFIEETGAAQHFRDARILPIYEGTTAIQANDLVWRKTIRDEGRVALKLCGLVSETETALAKQGSQECRDVQTQLKLGREAIEEAVRFMVGNAKGNPSAVSAASVKFLELCGMVFSGWQLSRAMLVATGKCSEDPLFYEAKIATAHFFALHILSQASGLRTAIVNISRPVSTLSPAHF